VIISRRAGGRGNVGESSSQSSAARLLCPRDLPPRCLSASGLFAVCAAGRDFRVAGRWKARRTSDGAAFKPSRRRAFDDVLGLRRRDPLDTLLHDA